MLNALERTLLAAAVCSRVRKRHGGAAWTGRPEALSSPKNPASRQHDTDRPGRVHESVGSAGHATKLRQNRYCTAKAGFARHLANKVEQAAAMRRDDGLRRCVQACLPLTIGHLGMMHLA